MPRKSTTFDFCRPVAYDDHAKRFFHSRARSQLRRLATALGLAPGSYDLRSNPAGIAVSGEITLHTDSLYVQASQSAMGNANGILFRTCSGRKDYVGGPNNFASLDLLNRPEELAQRIRERCHVLTSFIARHAFLSMDSQSSLPRRLPSCTMGAGVALRDRPSLA